MEDACRSARCARDQDSVFRVTRERPLERIVDRVGDPFRLVEDEQYTTLGRGTPRSGVALSQGVR